MTDTKTIKSKSTKSSKTGSSTKTFEYYEEEMGPTRYINYTFRLNGDLLVPHVFLVFLNRVPIIKETKWEDNLEINTGDVFIDLLRHEDCCTIADKPLMILLRTISTKPSKEQDPYLHNENRGGATVDLFPLAMGERSVCTKVIPVSVVTGEPMGITVDVTADTSLEDFVPPTWIALTLTMISSHCMLPPTKDNTVYISGIGLDRLIAPMEVNFGMSLSFPEADKLVWGTCNVIPFVGNTGYCKLNDDVMLPSDLEPETTNLCNNAYWNAVKRVLVDPEILTERLKTPFHIEVAGIPKTGKLEARGRYMGSLDASALLEPGEINLTAAAKLRFFVEEYLPEDIYPLLTFPPTSAKNSAKNPDFVYDMEGHSAFAIFRFDISSPLIEKIKTAVHYGIVGLTPPPPHTALMEELHVEPPPEDPRIDCKKIRKECGALAVHKELGNFACNGAIQMNQSIKRSAANRLLMRVRNMLRQFPPGDVSYLQWQDTVTAQHAATRRAVTASFAPQPPPPRMPGRTAATRSLLASDVRLASKHTDTSLQIAFYHPRPLLVRALRLLEQRVDSAAFEYIIKALNIQNTNKYLLWLYAGHQFDKGLECFQKSLAAAMIATKTERSDGTASAIGWAVVHSLNHYADKAQPAFVALKKMRIAYEVSKNWDSFLQRWHESSGEEETLWYPNVVSPHSPFLLASAFFLCLRCYKLSERLLRCYEDGCDTRGKIGETKFKICYDVSYLRVVSLVLRKQVESAYEQVKNGVKSFGPRPVLSHMQAIILMLVRGWDEECENALRNAEKSGADVSPALLMQAAIAGMTEDPELALQRAARAHKIAPGAYTALVIGRVYAKLGEDIQSRRWASAAVNLEPHLADGWAFLCILAMNEQNIDRARAMIRTAREAGPISPNISEEIHNLSKIVPIDFMSDYMDRDLCLCNYD